MYFLGNPEAGPPAKLNEAGSLTEEVLREKRCTFTVRGEHSRSYEVPVPQVIEEALEEHL